MNDIIIPERYTSDLNIIETQKAIKEIKDFFETNLANELNLTRVSAPLFVKKNTGINDNLSGIEYVPSRPFLTIAANPARSAPTQRLAIWVSRGRKMTKESRLMVKTGMKMIAK